MVDSIFKAVALMINEQHHEKNFFAYANTKAHFSCTFTM